MMGKGWATAPLGELLCKNGDVVELAPDKQYRELTVRLWGKGIVLRREVMGGQIGGTRRFRVTGGQFVLSRIDARHGAFGLVPSDLDGAVVSNDFPAFDLNERKLLPGFLGWLARTRQFVDLCKAASEGTTNRVRLKEDRFLAMQIPLPPLSEQGRIVAKIDRLAEKIEEARGLRGHASHALAAIPTVASSMVIGSDDKVTCCALRELGLDGKNPIQTGPFGAQLHKSEFTLTGVPVLNVGNVWPDGLTLHRLDHVTPEKANSLARYSLCADDLLFARSGATLGKVCIVPEKCHGWLMTGHLFRVRFDKKRCLPEYAFAALRHAEFVRDQVFCQVRGATRPGFNTTLLGNVRLPLPPLDEQRRIVAYLDGLQAEVDAIKKLQEKTAAELDALLPSILDKAFKGDL